MAYDTIYDPPADNSKRPDLREACDRALDRNDAIERAVEAAGRPSVVNLVPTKSDEEVATELRAELAPLLAQVAAVMTRARRQGIVINWGIGPDASGRDVIQNLTFAKYL